MTYIDIWHLKDVTICVLWISFLEWYIKTMTYEYDIFIFRYDDGVIQLWNMTNKDFNLYNMPRFDIRGAKIDEKRTWQVIKKNRRNNISFWGNPMVERQLSWKTNQGCAQQGPGKGTCWQHGSNNCANASMPMLNPRDFLGFIVWPTVHIIIVYFWFCILHISSHMMAVKPRGNRIGSFEQQWFEPTGIMPEAGTYVYMFGIQLYDVHYLSLAQFQTWLVPRVVIQSCAHMSNAPDSWWWLCNGHYMDASKRGNVSHGWL